MALTIREIENAEPAGKPYKLTDGGGLCLLIAPSGAKLWGWRYYFQGKEKMMAFGEYPLVSLKDVRELHFAARKTLAGGVDSDGRTQGGIRGQAKGDGSAAA
jgi:hypothetical protein